VRTPGGGSTPTCCLQDSWQPSLSTHNLRRVYQAAVAAAGEDLAHLDLHGPHDLRHTFASWLEDAGIPSRVIDELMATPPAAAVEVAMAVRWSRLPEDDVGHARPCHRRPRRSDQPCRTDC
jgi:integrase